MLRLLHSGRTSNFVWLRRSPHSVDLGANADELSVSGSLRRGAPDGRSAVTSFEIACQAVRDWFGKEVQNGYTMTYIWMANQLGHFTLGFLLTFLLTWSVEIAHAHWNGCSIWVQPACQIEPNQLLRGYILLIPVAQVLFWVAKELYDYHAAKRETIGNPFQFDHWDVFADAATAVGFITIGIAVAYLSFISWHLAIGTFIVGALVSLIPAHYWLARKMCFQQADLPFLYRLADFNSIFTSKGDSLTVDQYLAARLPARHLLIFGAMESGRTSLAVGIATEHCFKVRSARYMSWAKFLANAQRDPEPEMQEGGRVWPWRTSDIVVLDDVVDVIDGLPVTTPEGIATNLGKLPPNAAKLLGGKRTIWVLGPSEPTNPDLWIRALTGALDVADKDCCRVEIAPKPNRVKPKMPFAIFSGH
jgi:hypothetical protein